MLIYIFISNIVVAPIIFKVKEDIIIRFRVTFSITIIIILGLIVSVGVIVIIIIILILRRFPRACFLVSLFSLAERVFASFAL
jgi:hypothetical protein